MLVIAALGLAAASAAWACSGPDYGTPATPPTPPVPASPTSPAPTANATPLPPAPAPAPTAAPATVNATTSGAGVVRASAHVTAPVGTGQRSSSVAVPPVGAAAPTRPATSTVGAAGSSAYGAGALATRESGGTAGVTHLGGHSVFTSSISDRRARAAHRARATGRSAAHVKAPSQLSAVGDVWSGFAPSSRSPVSAAASASAGHGGGLSPQVLAGALVLSVGLIGACGGAFALMTSRRRKSARAGRPRD
ncbi:MAG TPA: hypothetical protein VG275_06420 [Solirubrobacteraceae bacterium]|nr:hypothetical protein [Solirubrobacteraceae bacterium]